MQAKQQSELVLYDFKAAKGGVGISPRTWRVRLALNYKEIPYRTEWLELPDIKAKGQEIGAPPTTRNPDGSGTMLWTVPMLVDPNHLKSGGRPLALSDSTPIVEYLDRTYPEKRLIPEGTATLIAAWERFIEVEISLNIYRLIVPLTPRILAEPSSIYFRETREKWWGPLDKFCLDRQKSLQELKAGLDKVAIVLGAGNLTVVPENVTYADFLLVAPLLWANAVLEEDELKEIRGWSDGKFGSILNGLKEQGLFRLE